MDPEPTYGLFRMMDVQMYERVIKKKNIMEENEEYKKVVTAKLEKKSVK
jgi:uncharacterized protein YktA (UPF0223 family)